MLLLSSCGGFSITFGHNFLVRMDVSVDLNILAFSISLVHTRDSRAKKSRKSKFLKICLFRRELSSVYANGVISSNSLFGLSHMIQVYAQINKVYKKLCINHIK